MTRSSVETVLRLLGVTRITSSGENWIMASCPLASTRHEKGIDQHPSCAVRVGSGPAYVVCHSCGFRGVLLTLIRACRKAGVIDRDTMEQASVLCDAAGSLESVEEAPEVAAIPQLDAEVLAHLSKFHSYFRKRHFTKREVLAWRLGYHRQAVLIPCVLADGAVPYVQVRLMREKQFFWLPQGIRRAHVAGSHLIPEGVRRLVVTEGVFDAMRIWRAIRRLGWKDAGAVALFGSNPSEDVREHLFSLVGHELIVATDGDTAGDICADKLTRIGQKRVAKVSRVMLPSEHDPDEAGTTFLMHALLRRENLSVRRIHLLHGSGESSLPHSSPDS